MGKVLDNIDFFGSMLITVVVALAVTVLVLFFDSLPPSRSRSTSSPAATGSSGCCWPRS